MTSNRANLDNPNSNSTLISITLFLFLLSAFGLYFRPLIISTLSYTNAPTITPEPTVVVEATPTEIVVTPTEIASASPTSAKLSPTITPTLVPSTKPTLTPLPTKILPTSTPNITAVPTPTFKTFSGDLDKFSVIYSSYRSLTQDKEGDGNRYTLYAPAGNIAIHIGKNWSWVYSKREFNNNLLVANSPTFVYDIPTQTIVDFQSGGLNYTIQCVHNGKADLKAECQQVLRDFKLL